MEKREHGMGVHKRNITPEEARQKTPLKLTPEQWQRVRGSMRGYDADRVFYGDPGKNVEGEGTIFDTVYDRDGNFCFGTITAQRVET